MATRNEEPRGAAEARDQRPARSWLLMIGFVAGLVGRRGFWTVPAAAVLWPGLLMATGVDSGLAFWIGAALGSLNTAVGMVVGYSLRWILDRGKPQERSPSAWAVEQTRGP